MNKNLYLICFPIKFKFFKTKKVIISYFVLMPNVAQHIYSITRSQPALFKLPCCQFAACIAQGHVLLHYLLFIIHRLVHSMHTSLRGWQRGPDIMQLVAIRLLWRFGEDLHNLSIHSGVTSERLQADPNCRACWQRLISLAYGDKM